MKITIRYFAVLKDQRGVGEDILENVGSTPKEVYGYLKNTYGLNFCQSKLKVAVNDEFAEWEIKLRDGDVLVYIPPVAGG